MQKKRTRAKRKSGALDRYSKNPSNMEGLNLRNSENVKVKNPLAEFEAEEKEKQKPFVVQAAQPKPEAKVEVKPDNIVTDLKTTVEVPTENDFTSEENMPLYCNYCSIQKSCPHGRAVKRKDQAELIICKKRNDFRKLTLDAGTSDRQGLITYIHKLRGINAARIGRMLYTESLSGEGQDRNLSLLIDKQIDNALAEYKLLTPKEKGSTFSLHLTQVHNTVDSFNELPQDLKQNLLADLKNKLNQIKNPLSITNRIKDSLQDPIKIPIVTTIVDNNTKASSSVGFSTNVGGAGEFLDKPVGAKEQSEESVDDL